MLKIGNRYYNAKEIRKLERSNRSSLVITYVNGEIENTDEYYDDYSFDALIKEWEKSIT